jgi:hypothetical protein
MRYLYHVFRECVSPTQCSVLTRLVVADRRNCRPATPQTQNCRYANARGSSSRAIWFHAAAHTRLSKYLLNSDWRTPIRRSLILMSVSLPRRAAFLSVSG